MIGDETERQRRLIVGVEIGPVHGHDDSFALADNLRHPRGKEVPHGDAWITQEAVDLLDRVLAHQAPRLGERLADNRHRQRRTVHYPQRAVGQRHYALGVKLADEHAFKESFNEFSGFDRMWHRRIAGLEENSPPTDRENWPM